MHVIIINFDNYWNRGTEMCWLDPLCSYNQTAFKQLLILFYLLKSWLKEICMKSVL